jgi:hypothetical protein
MDGTESRQRSSVDTPLKEWLRAKAKARQPNLIAESTEASVIVRR